MAKELLTREKIHNDLKRQHSVILKRLLGFWLTDLVIITCIIIYDVLIISFEDNDTFGHYFAIGCAVVCTLLVILRNVDGIYRNIIHTITFIKVGKRLKNGKFYIIEDEIDDVASLDKKRVKIVLFNFNTQVKYRGASPYSLFNGAGKTIRFKGGHEYMSMGLDSSTVSNSTSGDKAYLVFFEDINEPVMIYSNMIYEYKEEKH